jgi:hypothetical protein
MKSICPENTQFLPRRCWFFSHSTAAEKPKASPKQLQSKSKANPKQHLLEPQSKSNPKPTQSNISSSREAQTAKEIKPKANPK